MKEHMNKAAAIKAIERRGILLVYPINNTLDPLSLWYVWHPRRKMRWEWDENSDDSVADLWLLREKLSRSRAVIYSKWYRGRATCFSLPVFQAMLSESLRKNTSKKLSREAANLLSLLEERSPLSTKQLKRAAGLVGRALEPTYQKAMKELWERFLIVGYGEVDEGAFPSLAIGATRLIFEDLYLEAEKMAADKAQQIIYEKISESKKIEKFYGQLMGDS